MRRIASAVLIAAAVTAAAPVALAQGAPGAMKKESGGYRTFAMSLPMNFSREFNGRVELNLAGKGALAIEGGGMRRGPDVDEKHTEETGEFLESRGRGGMLMISRYSDGMSMSGFYWGLGVGYREVDARWSTDPDAKDPQVDHSLVDYSAREQGTLHHDVTMKGTTGTVRGGYRYVGESVPFAIGAFIGLRHYQAGVKDAERKAGDSDRWGEQVAYSRMTDRERERLRRRYTTRFEPGIELGFAF